MRKKDGSVEFLRVIACLMVIAIHAYSTNGNIGYGHTLLSCLIGDAVAIFWFVTGFFLFDGNIAKVQKRAIHKILIPLIFLSAFMFYFSKWICGTASFVESLSHTKSEYLEVVKAIFRWENVIDNLGPTWYLYVYLLVILCYPILKAFVRFLDENKKAEKIFLICSFLLFVVNDISLNQMAGFSHHTFGGAVPATIEIIWGHIIYKYRDKIAEKCSVIWFVCAFCGMNLLRMALQVVCYQRGLGNHMLYWYTSFGIVGAVTVSFICLKIDRAVQRDQIKMIVRKLGSYTFGIYLIHYMIMVCLNTRFGLAERIAGTLHIGERGLITDAVGLGLETLAIFAVSLMVCVIFRYIQKMFKKIVRK